MTKNLHFTIHYMEVLLMDYLTLVTGNKIPVIGSGTNTFGKENRDYNGNINGDTTELEWAIENGYRHFDTAISYRNESVVGKAIAQSGIPREEFFITSKIPGSEPYNSNEEEVKKAVNDSLEALQTDYIDLYLIHHPWDDLDGIVAVWKTLEKFVDEKTLKAIGVSNFKTKELDYLIEHATIKPAVNQVESHPGHWNDEAIQYALIHNIVPEAWGPLTRVSDEAKKVLTEIGEPYHKTWAQVILRYQIERNVVVIPKSHSRVRQAQNLDIFDFELNPEDRLKIAEL